MKRIGYRQKDGKGDRKRERARKEEEGSKKEEEGKRKGAGRERSRRGKATERKRRTHDKAYVFFYKVFAEPLQKIGQHPPSA